MPKQMSSEKYDGSVKSKTVEFNQALGLKREAMEALCGMVNTDDAHGIVFFGVDRNGDCRGIVEGNLDSAQQSLQQHIRDRFDPSIIPNIQIIGCEGRVLISVEAKKSCTCRLPLIRWESLDQRGVNYPTLNFR